MPEELFRLRTKQLELSWTLASKTPRYIAVDGGVGLLRLTPANAAAEIESVWRAGLDPTLASRVDIQVGPRLFEQTDYSLFIQSREQGRIRIVHRDPAITERFSYRSSGRTAYGTINFGSDVGRSTFLVEVDGRSHLELTVEVFPSKLDYESDYVDLLRDVNSLATGLALEFLRSTYRRGAAREGSRGSAIEWLDLLTELIDELERALRQVERRPHRTLAVELTEIPAHRVRRPDSAVRHALRGIRSIADMPRNVTAQPRRPTLRNAENAWLATQLSSVSRQMSRLRADSPPPITPRGMAERQEIETLAARIATLRRLEPLVAAEDLPPSNFASLQLMRLPGYREAYLALMTLRLGLALSGDALNLSTKELSLLYEYWCYLALVRLFEAEIGSPRLGNLFEISAGGLSLQLRKGRQTRVLYQSGLRQVELTYNPSFVTELMHHQPDIVVLIADQSWPAVLMILDAKYRVDASPEYTKQFGSIGPPQDAMNALHRYRDALLETTASTAPSLKRLAIQGAALFPYFERSAGDFGRTRLWTSLGTLGIGAIPALPSETSYLRTWLRSVLRRGAWSLSDQAISHIASDQASDWREAEASAVLVVDSARLLATGAGTALRLDLAGGATDLRELLQVTRVVLAAEVGPGRWQIDRSSEVSDLVPSGGAVLTLTYTLADPVPRSPIRWHSAEDSVDLPFLTTKLAFERANSIPELLLRTENEWRLLEELRAVGLIPALHVNRTGGRAPDLTWLIGPDRRRATFSRGSGFALRRRDGSDAYFSSAIDVLEELAKRDAVSSVS